MNSPLAAYHAHLASFDPANPVAMDLAHVQFICGAVLAHKPARLLELGIGSGFLSRAMLLACACNQRGKLTCVDNAHDWQGQPPPHFDRLAADGVNLVISAEHDFVIAEHEPYDLLVCDGDHAKTHQHAPHILRLAADGAFIFFHDTANPQFPNLGLLQVCARYSGFACHQFTALSLPNERTDRGLLMIINDRRKSWRTPPWLPVRHFLGRIRRRLRVGHS